MTDSLAFAMLSGAGRVSYEVESMIERILEYDEEIENAMAPSRVTSTGSWVILLRLNLRSRT